MMTLISSLISGILFGLGLILSGMTDPAKVIGFLDFFGAWNPALAFVMVGAILVSFFAFRYAGQRKTTLLGAPIRLPSRKDVDIRLILGSVVFGAGWGLAGYCPGPGFASILSGGMKPILFVLAMLFGMVVYEFIEGFKK